MDGPTLLIEVQKNGPHKDPKIRCFLLITPWKEQPPFDCNLSALASASELSNGHSRIISTSEICISIARRTAATTTTTANRGVAAGAWQLR